MFSVHTQIIVAFVALFSVALALVTAWATGERVWPFALLYTATGTVGLFAAHTQFALSHPDYDYIGFQFPAGLIGVFVVLMTVRFLWPRYAWVCDTSSLALGPLVAGARVACYRTGCCVEVRHYYVLLGVVLTVYTASWWRKREGDGRYGVRSVLALFLTMAALEYHYHRDPLLVPVALLGAVLAAICVR